MISRRSLLQAAGGTAFAQNSPKRALALIGDRYHNADYIRVALTRVLEGLNLKVDYTIDCDQLARGVLANYQLFICLRDGMMWPDGYVGSDAYPYQQYLENPVNAPDPGPKNWLKEEQAVALKDFVTAGNGFYSLHNNSHVSLSSKAYRDVMGGAYIGHPALRPFKVRVVNTSHPITQGVKDFMVTDEQHFVEHDKGREGILLESENIDGLNFENFGTKSIAGWAHEYGRGRVVFTAVGHTIHALWNPEYVKLQKRAVQWLLKEI